MTREIQGHDKHYVHDSGVGFELYSGATPDNFRDGIRFRPETLDSPVHALDLHLHLWSWMSTPDAVQNMGQFAKLYGPGFDPDDPETAPALTRGLQNNLNVATTSFISPDVADLVQFQGLAMPPDMLLQTDVPYANGFAVLGKCWSYMDLDEGEYIGKIPVRAVMWWEGPVGQDDGTHKPGIVMALYADADWVEACLGKPLHTVFESAPPPLFLVDIVAWTYSNWWVDAEEPDGYDIHHQAPHCGEFRRKLLALFRFMQEEIVSVSRHRPPRPAARRWERSKINNAPDDGCIVSVHLRRYSQKSKATDDEEREAREVFWSHRWWVRGHYRFNPRTGIKDIWIRPYIKGPEGMPLVLKEKLVSVDR